MAKSAFFNSILFLSFVLFLPIALFAQDEARAVWQVTNFDIVVNNLGSDRALNARATVALRNVGRGSGSTLSLRINSKAEIKSVTVGGATMSYHSLPETRGGAQRIAITLTNSVNPNEGVTVGVDYRLPLEENTGVSAISPAGSQFLPLSLWYPSPNTPFAVRGADYAPFRLTINGGNAISSGVEKSSAGNTVFEQNLNGQPFFVVGDWERIDGSAGAKGIAAFLPKGAGDDARKQADRLIALASDARALYATLFGAIPDVPVRLIAVRRGAGFDDSGSVLISEGAFRRTKVDSVTALAIAEAIARLWIGSDTPVRGDGYGVIREGLTRFFANLFIEKEFGAEAAAEELARQRLAYSAIAKRDAPLARTTRLEPTYFNSVANKGAMVWRLSDHVIGRESFIATIRGLLARGKTDSDGFSLNSVRAALSEAGGSSLKNILDRELDEATDMDLMAGLPQQQGGQWTVALRNAGSFDANVNVAATTDAGQTLVSSGTIPARDFGQVSFQSSARIVRVEVDPEKFLPQTDYANDIAPQGAEPASALAETMRLFGTQEYSKGEALARQLLAFDPRMQEARILLARALLGENKIDDAEREFRQLTGERLPTPAALAWSSVGLGEIAMRRGQAKEAARLFDEAVRADSEYASTLAARAARIRAEAAANSAPQIDESAKNFIGQLDAAIRSGRQAEIAPLIVPGELSKFIRGAVGTQPEVWQTRVLRTEQLDANQIAVDVALQTKQLGVEHSGTAVLVLARVNGGWKLNAIELFEVR